MGEILWIGCGREKVSATLPTRQRPNSVCPKVKGRAQAHGKSQRQLRKMDETTPELSPHVDAVRAGLGNLDLQERMLEHFPRT